VSTDPSAGTERLYRAAVGPQNAEFYIPKFIRFDEPGASKVSWNWPAFFLSFCWFLYRRMYKSWLIYCWLIPFGLGIVGGISTAFFGRNLSNSFFALATFGYTYVVIPIFANSIYHDNVRQRISELRATVSDPAAQLAVLENSPHTNVVIVVVVLFLWFILSGILAAIALPAYQDYALRLQVADGLVRANPLKAAIVAKYAADRSWPESYADLGEPQPIPGRYVTRIVVDHGTISIKYGKNANGPIAGHVLGLRPSVSDSGRVVWTCGYAASLGKDPASGPAASLPTDVPARYLPPQCRS
jgi:Tfp pilus assembly major pilin PilA